MQQEIYLHRDDLVKILEFVDKINPVDTLRLQAGQVKITSDNSSGIGSTITATTVQEYAPLQFGELTITISDVENW